MVEKHQLYSDWSLKDRQLAQIPFLSQLIECQYFDSLLKGKVLCYILAALNPELKTTLDKVVTSHKVILFMKGTKDFPQCGFSNTVVQILKTVNVPFETINILDNEMLRQGLKEYSQWPTFPQLYIDGEFFGGCDIAVGKNSLPHAFLEYSHRVYIHLSSKHTKDHMSLLHFHILMTLPCSRVPICYHH